MAFSWVNTWAAPLPIGGAAKLSSKVEGADEVIAVLGSSEVTNPDDLPLDSVAIPLSHSKFGWGGVVWGAHAATRVSWFAKVAGGAWEVGPWSDIALPFTLTADFPLPVGWVVDRLQDYAAGCPPLRSREFAVAVSYPRDVAAWPMASVQVDDISLSAGVVQNRLGPLTAGSAYTVTFSVVCWCATPEDRRILTPWLAGALEAVRLCAKDYVSVLYDPHFTISESEDFQTMGVPAFLSTARFTATVLSSLSFPQPPSPGLVTVI